MRQLTARARDWRHSLDLHRSPSFRGPARTRRPVCCPLPEKPRVAGVAERRRRGAAGRQFGGARAARSPGGQRSRPSSPAWRSDESYRWSSRQRFGGARPARRRLGATDAAGNPSRAPGLLVDLVWEMRKKGKKTFRLRNQWHGG
jgi:hypothetical protein